MGPDLPTGVNFGGVASRAAADPDRARVVFVPAPFEGSVSYGTGTARGPAAILAASLQVETHDEETGVNLEDLSFAVEPSVEPSGHDPFDYSERVRAAVRPIVRRGAVPFVLGGEHSVTIGAVRAVRETYAGAHVLSIDAHGDLRERFEGSDHSHACVMRRLLEEGPITIVGARSWSAEEAGVLATERRVHVVPARDVVRGRVSARELVDSLRDPVYVTFDVDGLDPSVIPATGTPEPGGLGWLDALELLRTVFEHRRVVGMDIVELAPGADSRVSEFAAARLAAKMLSYLRDLPMKGA
jgi:agmatinase